MTECNLLIRRQQWTKKCKNKLLIFWVQSEGGLLVKPLSLLNLGEAS